MFDNDGLNVPHSTSCVDFVVRIAASSRIGGRLIRVHSQCGNKYNTTSDTTSVLTVTVTRRIDTLLLTVIYRAPEAALSRTSDLERAKTDMVRAVY
jgi:hypothetical protein